VGVSLGLQKGLVRGGVPLRVRSLIRSCNAVNLGLNLNQLKALNPTMLACNEGTSTALGDLVIPHGE
jgi:hypothetical protein